MKIKNETEWNGRHLRTLCRRVIDQIDGDTARVIEIKTSRTRDKDWHWEASEGQSSSLYRGRASIGSKRKLYMGVPKPAREVKGEWYIHEFQPKTFARVLEHELFHQLGLRHGDMHKDVQYCRQDVDYADGFTVEPVKGAVPQEARGE